MAIRKSDWIPESGQGRAFLLLMAFGAFLRFFRIGQQSFWADEVTSLWAAGARGTSLVEGLSETFHGPLHFLVLSLWSKIGGYGEVWSRSLSAITGLLALWAIYLLARRLAGSRVALYSLFLLAISPLHVWYSQEVRNYSQLFLLALFSMIFFLRILDRGGWKNWLLFLLLSLAGFFSNLAMAFLLAFQALWLLMQKPRLARKLLLALALLLILLLPWFSQLEIGWRPDMVGKAGVVRNVNFHPLAIPYTLVVYSVGDTIGPSRNEMNRALSADLFRPFLYYFAAAGLVFASLFFLGLRERWRKPEGAMFFLLWLLIPMLLVSLLAFLNVKAYNVRYVWLGMPAYLILLASAIASGPARWRWTFLIAISVLSFFPLANLYGNSRYWKPDAREAASLLHEKSREGDLVLVYSITEPLEHYYRGPGDLRGLDWAMPSTDTFRERFAEFEKIYDRVWLVDYRAWYMDPAGEIPKVFEKNWFLSEVFRVPGIEIRFLEGRKEKE